MKTPLPFLLIVATIFTGCKKSQQQQPAIPQPSHDLSKMNGTHIGIGTGGTDFNTSPPDAFSQFNLLQLNDSTIVVDRDTLLYTNTDSVTHIIHYVLTIEYYPVKRSSLSFDPSDNSLKFEWDRYGSSGGAGFELRTSPYKPNNSLKSYIPSIEGTKNLSGTGYIRYPGVDSNFSLTTPVKFTAVNDSTITFDDLLQLGDYTLHYKSTDEHAGTITFETFHVLNFSISTLTYNYISNSLVLEQHYMGAVQKYVRLQ